MQLIKLSANKSSFKTVHFKNETGLNFIVATQKNPEGSEKGETFNGVGKSLIVALTHFCLGSSKKDSFKDNLEGWVFSLTFKIGRTIYTSERSTDLQNKIKLNEKELGIKSFNKRLESLLFDIPEDISQLSFRSLLPFFIRPKRASYTSFKNPNAIKNDFQVEITNAFLLGLDVSLVEEKFKLRGEKERIRKLVKELSDDKLLKEFFIGKKDVSLAQQELEEQIIALEADLKNFKVAEDYYEIKNQADQIKNDIDRLQNNTVLIQNQVENIEESRKITPDIKKENIERIYKEATVIINDETVKTLSELEKFYEHLSKSREKRLLEQKNKLQKDLSEKSTLIKSLKGELDSKLKYLDAHQALDIFVKLTNQLSDLKTKHENIARYDTLISEYRNSKLEIEKKFIEATKTSDLYLSDVKDFIKSITDFFRELSKRFYPRSAAGITIYNNIGDNQIRFDIDAKIEADQSDGINNIKIFCYDLTVLLKGSGHHLNFLFHDSRLLSDTDPRQTSEVFKTLSEYIQTSNKQYILTLNQNQLDEVKKYLSEDEYKSIIEDNICLKLKDQSAGDKLLGIQVNMKYD
jgi:uncharacterized protein YydD (DUF2326 family)